MLFSALAYLVCVFAFIGALRHLETSWQQTCTPLSIAGGSILQVAFFAWTMFAVFGGVDSESGLGAGLVALAFQALAGCVLFAPALRRKLSGHATKIRPVAVLLSLFLGVFLIEYPYSTELFNMGLNYLALNVALVGAFALAVWLFAQRRMWGLIIALAVCLVAGLADYFLMLFKGTTILPSDLMALSTAAQVAGGYTPVFHDSALTSLAVFLAFSAFVTCLPNPGLTRVRVAVNVVLGALVVFGLVHWYDTTDIEKDCEVEVDVWGNESSYMMYGAVPCFLQRLQEICPDAPSGYSTATADELLADLAARWDEAHPGYPQTMEDYLAQSDDDEAPSVVCIMNESFSDLSMYDGVEGYEGTTYVNTLEVAEGGALYVSARGGGTCNTEFEFLTGSSLGMVGGGVYPYMFYDLGGVQALPNLFSGFGYTTTAIHPCTASNWRRDVVYSQLGFSQFISADNAFEGAQTLRGKVRDSETYRVALDQLSQDGPQFIFDVTYMGHGGYLTGELDSYPYDGVTVAGQTVEGMSEYLSVMDEAQDDLAWFLSELSRLDKKVVVVFFGDHQPGFNDELSQASLGEGASTLEGVQQRFSTQYFVWANYDLDVQDDEASQLDLSVNYLGAQAVYQMGLPLSDLQKARLYLMESMPATNLNGYCDADCGWFWNGEDGPVKDVYDEYAILQYRNLFDSSRQG